MSLGRHGPFLNPVWTEGVLNRAVRRHPLMQTLMYKDQVGFFLKWTRSGCLEKETCNGLGDAERKEKDVFLRQTWILECSTRGSFSGNWFLQASVSVSVKRGGAPAPTPLPPGDFVFKSDNGVGKPWRKARRGISELVKCFRARALPRQLSEPGKEEIMKATEKAVL